MKCHNCGKEGPHYVPPSLGEPGFYHCEPEQTMFIHYCPWPAKVIVTQSTYYNFSRLVQPEGAKIDTTFRVDGGYVEPDYRIVREHVPLCPFVYVFEDFEILLFYGWYEADRTVLIQYPGPGGFNAC